MDLQLFIHSKNMIVRMLTLICYQPSQSEIVSNEHKQLDLSTNPNILITYLSLYFNVIIFSLQYIIIFVPCYVLLEVFVQDSLVEFFFDSIGVLIVSMVFIHTKKTDDNKFYLTRNAIYNN